MAALRISTEAIDQGLDRKNLSLLKQRFQQINSQRFERTHSALPDRQKIFLELLPLLLHCNHPMLPGYVSNQTPCGVSGYTPKKAELQLAKTLARSFNLQHDPHKHRYIYAAFLMGSVGTIAHSESSDLDIWLCHKPGLTPNSIQQLELKCQHLTQWAAQLGLEAHFFLMDHEKFNRGESSVLNSEASGSAQHYLLLDEFYRTAILLCGRIPLWWLVPSKCEPDYDRYAGILLNKRFVRSADTLDFGGITEIPDGEFVGAGVWQLYKAIESPYKSVLKLLLLECYASEHPHISPLSLNFKQQIYYDNLNVNELDPYVMVYHRLADYLVKRNEPKRLELLRRCFYFKVNKALTKTFRGKQKSWQRQLLEKLVTEWGWSEDHLRMIDSRPHWKALRVITERKALANELTNSYRFLMDFARQTQASASINVDELNILGRKLYAAYERKAGKVDLINPGISPDLTEPHLTLVATGDKQSNGTVWSAYTQSVHDAPYLNSHKVKQTRHLMELILWCYCNCILTPNTQVELIASGVLINATQLRQIILGLAQWLPLPLVPSSHENFQSQSQIRNLLLLINVGTNPHQHLEDKGIHRLSEQSDPLNYSAHRENLVASVDMFSLNSWNEVYSAHFSSDALLSSLLLYLQQTKPGDNTSLPQLNIRCISPHRGNAISQRVEELFRDVAACFYSGTRPICSRYIFEMEGHFFSLQFIDNEPQINRHSNLPNLLEYLSLPQTRYSPIMIDRNALNNHPLKTIASASGMASASMSSAIIGNAKGNTIQVFFQTDSRNTLNRQATIYILDELGSLFSTTMPFHDTQTLLRPLHRFIRAAIDRQHLETDHFQSGFGIHPVDFYELIAEKDDTTQLKRRNASTELSRLTFFNIQVIAEATEGQQFHFSIYCDQQEFTEIEHGEELYNVVAGYILSRRQSGERYPCYITDLDLSQCRSALNQASNRQPPSRQGSLQIVHYLTIKAQLESRLNSALQSL